MEGTPTNVDIRQIRESLLALNHVKDVHDLHVWSITSGFPALSCHLIAGSEADRDQILSEAKNILQDKYHIEHTTIQIDKSDTTCVEKGHCN